MTIFTAFYVPEGIVMTADSGITLNTKKEDGTVEREILSDSEQKIFLLRNEDVGLVYTVEDMPDGFTMSEFIKNMNKFIIKSHDTIKDLASKITFYLERDVKNIKISIIIAGFDNGEPYVCLIQSEKDRLSAKILNRDMGNRLLYRATIGGNMERVNQIFNYDRSFDDYSVEEALEYGCYLVNDSIEFLNSLNQYSDVGGEVRYLVIRRDGRITFA